MEEFSKVAVGEIQKQFLIELRDKIKHKFNMIRSENEKSCEVSFNFLNYFLMMIACAYLVKYDHNDYNLAN